MPTYISNYDQQLNFILMLCVFELTSIVCTWFLISFFCCSLHVICKKYIFIIKELNFNCMYLANSKFSRIFFNFKSNHWTCTTYPV